MPHRYYCAARPPWYAQVPDGSTASEVWMPGRRVLDLPGDWHALGWVEYAAPLEYETLNHWSLVPADEKERAGLTLWRKAREWHDAFEDAVAEYQRSIKDYGLAYMQEKAETDDAAEAALIWLGLLVKGGA